MDIIKKNGRCQAYDFNKTKRAVTELVRRVNVRFSQDDWSTLESKILTIIGDTEKISVEQMHNTVELALDMVKLQDNCLAYEVDRTKEFAPVKNKTGVDSVDTARELLKQNGVEI